MTKSRAGAINFKTLREKKHISLIRTCTHMVKINDKLKNTGIHLNNQFKARTEIY